MSTAARLETDPRAVAVEVTDDVISARLADGRTIEADRGFTAFGGNEVRSSLGAQLGAKLSHNRHIETDSRTKLTSVRHLWAAGDVAVHSEQSAIAMGDGSQAAIWMHKSLADK